MSAIHLDNRLVHYEVFGRGQPIIFMHSWLGSWRYWVPTMELAAERYRAYALDFWGFGESDRKGGEFSVDGYVAMLGRFMERMGIASANLVGHGLGGMVAIRAAAARPERFPKVMTVATPLVGQSLVSQIKPGTLSKLFGGGSTNVWARLLRSMPVADPEVQQELVDDTEGLSEQVLVSVQDSLLATNLQVELRQLAVPLLAVYGGQDKLVGAEHAAAFLNELADRPVQLLVLPKANHFPFLEQSNTFSRLLLDFLVSQGTPVEIKEEWRRRVNQREYL